MKYIKLFEEKLESDLYDIIVKMANCDASITKDEYLSFSDSYLSSFFHRGKNKTKESFGKYQDMLVFFKEFFCNLRKNPDSIQNPFFRDTLFDSENIFGEKSKSNKAENYYRYVPSNPYTFFKCLDFISNDGIKYNFFDLGSGLPIKVLAASLFGYKSLGFEINSDLIHLSHELGISDLIQDKSMYDVNFKELQSSKIIYYYNPIYKPDQMAIYENEIIKSLNPGDILFRVVLPDVNKFIGFGNKFIHDFKEYDPNSKLTKHLGNQPEIYKMKLLYHFADLGPSYSVWKKL